MTMNLVLSVTFILTLFCGILPSLAKRDIRHPPDIVLPSFAEIRYFSDSFNLSCEATGSPSPTYMWRKDETPITSEYINVDALTGDLRVDSASKREEGVYRCLANNTWGTAMSNSVHMIYIMSRSFEKQESRKTTISAGSSLSLRCRNPPKSVPAGTFSWYLTDLDSRGNKGAVSISPKARIGVDEEGTLHFAFVTSADAIGGKEYACAVGNYKTSTITLGSKVQVTVNGNVAEESKPTRLYKSGTKKELVGQKASLECFFSGNPVPTISWFASNKKVEDNPRLKISDFNRRLEIVNVTESDEGEYRCEATNTLGTQVETLFLNVTSKPIWVHAPRSQTTIEGRDVKFTCKARPARQENQPAAPVWFQNGDPLEQNDSRIVQPTTFMLSSVSRDRDIMNVQCLIQNEFGSIFKDAFLNVLLPITLTTRPPRSIRIDYGDMVNLTVSATTDPSQNLTLRWKHKGEHIDLLRPGLALTDDSRTLTINTSKMSEDDMDTILGMYTCIVSHAYETVVVEVYVTETPIDPKITIVRRPPSEVSIAHGEVVDLSVSATTHPSETLIYQWRHKDMAISMPRLGFTVSKDSSSLTINTTVMTQEEMNSVLGEYTCNVSNSQQAVTVTVVLKAVRGPGGLATGGTASNLWILAVVLGILLLVGASVLVACFLRQRYPKRVYLLEKKELKNKLDPVRDVENEYFQTL